MNVTFWSGVVLVLATCVAAAQEPPAQPAAVTRQYDVRALEFRRLDDDPPALGFVGDPSAPARSLPIVAEDPDEQICYRIEGPQTMIQENLAKGTWEGENTLKTNRGIVHVRHTPDVHATIALVIEALRSRLERPVALELREVRAPVDVADAVLAGGPVLDAARAALVAGEGFTRVRSARLVGISGQRLHRGSTRVASYVRGYEAAPGSGAAALQPATGRVRTGDLDVWRAVLDNDGRGLIIEYRRDTVAAAQPHPTYIVGRTRPDGGPPRTLELPRLAERRTATAMWMPCGGQAIVEAWRDGDQMHLVVLGHLAAPSPRTRESRAAPDRMDR